MFLGAASVIALLFWIKQQGEGHESISDITEQTDNIATVDSDQSVYGRGDNVGAKGANLNVDSELETLIAEFRSLYGDAGSLDFDAAKKQVTARKDKTQLLVSKMSALGLAGIPGLLQAYANAVKGKEKLFLIDSLSGVNNDAGVSALEQILKIEQVFSYQEYALKHIAEHKSAEAVEILSNVLNTNEDLRLRIGAIHALTENKEALPLFIDRIANDQDEKVRIEIVRAIGLNSSPEGFLALQETIALQNSITLKKYAIMELARSYGNEAKPILEILLNDSDSQVSQSAQRAIKLIPAEVPPASTMSVQ